MVPSAYSFFQVGSPPLILQRQGKFSEDPAPRPQSLCLLQVKDRLVSLAQPVLELPGSSYELQDGANDMLVLNVC